MAQSLQIAQIIADLSTLQNTSHEAAQALLLANKTLAASRPFYKKVRLNSLPNRPTFDSLGKRHVGPIITMPLVGTNGTNGTNGVNGANGSYMDHSSAGTQSGDELSTPLEDSTPLIDEELERASNLVALYEMRGKFQKMGDSGLGRAKERVDQVVKELDEKKIQERERLSTPRY